MQIWLTAEAVIELGMPRATLFWRIQKGKITARPGGKAANGKPRREIALESLPAEIQERYVKSQISDFKEESRGSGADIPHDGAGEPPPAPLPPVAKDVQSVQQIVQSVQAVQIVQRTGNPLAGLSEKKLEELTNYAEALRRADGKPRKMRAWIAKRAEVSLTTLDRDLAAFKAGSLAGIVRKKRKDAGRPRAGDEQVVSNIQREYLQLHRPSARAVYKKICRGYELSDLKPPSFSWVLRQIQAIPPDSLSKYRSGEKHYRDHFEYSSTRERPPLPRQWVDADHHEADHYVVFSDGTVGRPFLTAAHDLCTSEILSLRIPRDKRVGRGRAPGALDIGLVVRAAILKKDEPDWPSFGLFECLYHDLGKDFLSSYLRAVCADLSIRPVPCRGYHGQSKPIERWFRTLEDGTRHLPGYCGSKPENNPYRSGVRPQEPDPKSLLTLDQYESALRDWTVKEYHHRGQAPLSGASPLEALAAHVKNGFSPREVRDERALDLLLMRRAQRAGGEPIKVQKYGFKLFGRIYMHPALLDLIGREIEPRYDEAKMGEVICYHRERFVCVATNKELLQFGASKETLERERELKREQKRRLEERHQQMLMQAQYPNPLARAAAEERYEKVLGEERKKIAVNAEAEGVPVLLPKYAHAAKGLRKVQGLREVKSLKPAGQREGRGIEEDLPTAEEIFKRDPNPWAEEDEEPPTTEEIFKREKSPYLEEEDNG